MLWMDDDFGWRYNNMIRTSSSLQKAKIGKIGLNGVGFIKFMLKALLQKSRIEQNLPKRCCITRFNRKSSLQKSKIEHNGQNAAKFAMYQDTILAEIHDLIDCPEWFGFIKFTKKSSLQKFKIENIMIGPMLQVSRIFLIVVAH